MWSLTWALIVLHTAQWMRMNKRRDQQEGEGERKWVGGRQKQWVTKQNEWQSQYITKYQFGPRWLLNQNYDKTTIDDNNNNRDNNKKGNNNSKYDNSCRYNNNNSNYPLGSCVLCRLVKRVGECQLKWKSAFNVACNERIRFQLYVSIADWVGEFCHGLGLVFAVLRFPFPFLGLVSCPA